MDLASVICNQRSAFLAKIAIRFFSGEIHLTPLKGVIQLRPHFEYLDRNKEKKPDANDEG